MATIDRLCTYPIFNNATRDPGGQNTIKEFIKDLDTLLTDAGLVRTISSDHLDVDDIDDIDLSTLYTNINDYWNYNRNQSAFYKPIEYNFDDELQTIDPIKIKFEFFYFRYNKLTAANVNISVPLFGVYITVSNSRYSQSFWQTPYVCRSGYDIGHDTGFQTNRYRTLNDSRVSNICYDKDKGYLLLNICPGFRFTNIGPDQPAPTIPIIFLCVHRSHDKDGNITKDFIRLIARNNYTINTTSNGWYYNSSYFRHSISRNAMLSYVLSYYSSIDIYESNTQFQVPYNVENFYNNTNYYTYMSTIYDVNNRIPVYDPFVLIGNTVMAGFESTSIYNIKLNDNETKNYLAISQYDMCGYPYHANQCLLMYYN